MPATPSSTSSDSPEQPVLSVQSGADALTINLAGRWTIAGPVPGLTEARAALQAHKLPVRFTADGLTQWDSLAVAALWSLQSQCRELGLAFDDAGLPEGLRAVLALAKPAAVATAAAAGPAPGARAEARTPGRLARVGRWAIAWLRDGAVTLEFVGQSLQALLRLPFGRSRMRMSDLWFQIDTVGPRSLPIVSLISFLVGLILAYMGAVQLQRFGAQIYIADLVTIGMVREIAALMTAIILAGRVGAAFAAQLGTMQTNEEIDALRAMGLPPVEHLVLPRLIALTLVSPLLVAYAAAVGMLAGLLVAVIVFGLTPLEYYHQSVEALVPADIAVGLIKGTVYAALVALAGCRQGINAGRSAQAVGEATTRAVVQAIVWIVVAASALTIVFQRLDI